MASVSLSPISEYTHNLRVIASNFLRCQSINALAKSAS
jgi:hypothetical protein